MTKPSGSGRVPEPILEWQAQWSKKIDSLRADLEQSRMWEAEQPNSTDGAVVALIRRADVAAKALERIPLKQLRTVLENRIHETVYSGLAMNNVQSTASGYSPEQLKAHRSYEEECKTIGLPVRSFGPTAYNYEMIARVLGACVAIAEFGSKAHPKQAHVTMELRPPQRRR